MLKDGRTWTTLGYFILMLPLGIGYFVIAIVGLSVGLAMIVAPPLGVLQTLGWLHASIDPPWIAAAPLLLVMEVLGLLILTCVLHTARGIGRFHARLAKRLLVTHG